MKSRYKGIKTSRTEEGKKYLLPVIYPSIEPTREDVYLLTSVGDRFDILAQQYYNDSSLWWIIATENSQAYTGGLFPKPGVQIRIPANKNSYLEKFRELNNV